MDNVVLFPKEKRDSPPQSLEETIQKIVKNRTDYSVDVCSDILDTICSIFMADNIDINSDMLYADLELLKDALLSLHLKANGISYGIQDIAEQLYLEPEVNVEEILEEE